MIPKPKCNLSTFNNNKTIPSTPKKYSLNYEILQTSFKTQIEKLTVYTPYEPYDTQKSYMAYIIRCLNSANNGVIQSPTGTGKTLSLLASTLAWQYNQFQKGSYQNVPQIYYTSRTHQQLKQTINQLKKLPYKVKISILSSRQHSCVNLDLKQLTGKDKGFQCRKRIMHKQGKSCAYYKQDSYFQGLDFAGKVLDLDEIVLRGKIQKFCPYYFNKSQKNRANIIFMPYNYLFQNQYALEQNGINLKNSILIIDEAHNIQQTLQQSKQYTLTLNILSRALSQISQLHQQKITQIKSQKIVSEYSEDMEDFGELKWKKKINSSLESIQYHGSYVTLIHYYFQTIDIPNGVEGKLFNIQQFIQIIQKATQDSQFGVITKRLPFIMKQLKSLRDDLKFRPFWAVQSWAQFMQRISELYKIYQKDKISSKFRIQILYEGSDIKMNIYCLDSSIGMQNLLEQKPRSVILTSGTLSPIKSFTMQLHLHNVEAASCPHIIQPNQAKTYIITKGPNKISLNFSYENRFNNKVYQQMGLVLSQIVKNTPNGVVVFFPSYMLLQETVKNLNSAKLLSKIYEHKSLHIQTRQSTEMGSVLERYLKDAQSSKGAVLFALIRGKISQGLDFADQKCRAVIIIGVPYPARKDIKVISKMQYLNQLCEKQAKDVLSGQKWYLSQAIRSINQGIGRIIRHKKDYGTIYLLDERYEKQKPDLKGQLSSWARASLNIISNYSDLADYFKRSKQQLTPIIQKNNQGLKQSIKPVSFGNFKSISGGFKGQKQDSKNDKKNQNGSKIGSLKSMLAQLKSNKQKKQPPKPIVQQKNKIILQNQEKQKIPQNIKKQNELVKQKDNNQPLPKLLSLGQNIQKTRVSFNKIQKIIPLDQMQQCPICKTNQKLIKNSVCSHSFCQQCWKNSLKIDLRCPLCRTRVRQKFLVIQ